MGWVRGRGLGGKLWYSENFTALIVILHVVMGYGPQFDAFIGLLLNKRFI